MAARALSTASVSFGLVSIPVKLFTTVRSDSTIRFNQLDKNGARLKQQYISSQTGEVVSAHVIARPDEGVVTHRDTSENRGVRADRDAIAEADISGPPVTMPMKS